MKRLLIFTVFFFIRATMTFGMSQYSKDDIAIPTQNFIIDVEDMDGIVTRGENVTFDNETFLTVRRGSTDIYIPFDRISKIDILNNEEVITKEEKEIPIVIHMSDGSSYESMAMSHHEVTGDSRYGRFRIRLDRIKSIVFIEMK